MRYAEFSAAYETKALNEQNGEAHFTGIASTSDLDLHNDVMTAGAFEPFDYKSNGEPLAAMLRGHNTNQVIGGWKKFSQEGQQLKVEGALCLASNPLAQETYELMKRGYLSGLSVGYQVKPNGATWDEKSGRRTISKAKLVECSIVAIPANPKARIRDVKADGQLTRGFMRDWLDDQGFASSEIDVIMAKGFDALIAVKQRPLLITAVDDDDELPDDMVEPKESDPKKPYGDVTYADPGYQEDGKKRYPIDTEAHIRAAWNYINKEGNAAKYSSDQVSKIKAKIVAAWKSKIDPKGPPSADGKEFDAVSAQVKDLLAALQERASR